MISVLVPAHNEERVIGRCLSTLLDDFNDGDGEIVVVCNGCEDRTATIARSFGDRVKVLDIPVASKTAALNAGEVGLTAFPRFYVDADVSVSMGVLCRTAHALERHSALAGAPRLSVTLAGRNLLIRAYFAVWCRLPYVTTGLLGSGVAGVTEEGRRRFGLFPDIIADDFYLRCLFAPGERLSVSSETFVSYPPTKIRDLIARKSRSYAGLLQADRLGLLGGAAATHPMSWLGVVIRNPALLPAAPVYVLVNLVAKVRARRKLLAGDLSWNRDASSRECED